MQASHGLTSLSKQRPVTHTCGNLRFVDAVLQHRGPVCTSAGLRHVPKTQGLDARPCAAGAGALRVVSSVASGQAVNLVQVLASSELLEIWGEGRQAWVRHKVDHSRRPDESEDQVRRERKMVPFESLCLRRLNGKLPA